MNDASLYANCARARGAVEVESERVRSLASERKEEREGKAEAEDGSRRVHDR